MSHIPYIRALGGPTALARALGIAEKIPLHWGARGIPPRYWHHIERLPLAAEHGITIQLLDNTSPQRRSAADGRAAEMSAA